MFVICSACLSRKKLILFSTRARRRRRKEAEEDWAEEDEDEDKDEDEDEDEDEEEEEEEEDRVPDLPVRKHARTSALPRDAEDV